MLGGGGGGGGGLAECPVSKLVAVPPLTLLLLEALRGDCHPGTLINTTEPASVTQSFGSAHHLYLQKAIEYTCN